MRDDSTRRVLARYLTAAPVKDPNAGKALELLSSISHAVEMCARWIGGFPNVLRAAKTDLDGLESGEVWQEAFSDYWETWQPHHEALRDLLEALQDIVDVTPTARVLHQATMPVVNLLYPITNIHAKGYKAKPIHGASKPLFKVDLATGQRRIAYPEKIVKEWADAFQEWVQDTRRAVATATKAVNRLK